MTFLQPILLAGLPLVALPILIHLINRQRHLTIQWGAMLFLRDAKRLTRGVARLRYWLIMAMRMLAIGALVLAIARPLASGRVGLALGGAPDTTIVVLDRSASMEQQEIQTGDSKRSSGLRKISELIRTLGTGTSIVLIENGANQALSIESADALMEHPETAATDTSADIVAMLQTALDYVVANQTGRTDVWVCSDLRAGDWNVDDGRWSGLRDGFGQLEGVRFYLLSYADVARENLAVWVSDVRRRASSQSAELVFDVKLQRPPGSTGRINVPLEFVINGARSVMNIEMMENAYALQGHTVALDESTTDGWGRIDLPTDANPRDNSFYFVFGQATERHTVIVSDDMHVAEPLRIATTSPLDPTLTYTATVLAAEQVSEIAWETASLIVWQAPLPRGVVAQQLEAFVDSGRPVIFFAPENPGQGVFCGMRWSEWQQTNDDEPAQVASWRNESDLLQHAENGNPLPVGGLRVHRYCSLEGNGRVLARLNDGHSLLVRGDTEAGSAYFCTALPRPTYSTFLQDGVVFYVMIQRALAIGAAVQGNVQQLSAGTLAARQVATWRVCSTSHRAGASSRAVHAGAFRQADKLIALNRPASEDQLRTLADSDVSQLFRGLHLRHVKEQVGSSASLASEVWRIFVVLMAAALIVEAGLCMPEKKVPATND